MAAWLRIIEGAPLLRALLGNPLPVPHFAVRRVIGRLYLLFAFAHPRSVDPRMVAAFTSHVRSKRDARRILATGRQVVAELDDCFEHERISCPVLVLWGERDRMVYASGADRVLAAVNGSRLELIGDCGHCPQVEAPDRVVELLTTDPRGWKPDGVPARTARGGAEETTVDA
jgi:pimeloyl-ACP methyl ester carboxylesterase